MRPFLHGRTDLALAVALCAGTLPLGAAAATDNAAASAADLDTYGYAARGSERIGELYDRIHLNDHVEITPSLQYIARPAADPDAKAIAVVGLRARVGF